MTNIFGPGHYATTGEVASRPSPIATGKPSDTWFAQCNPDGTGGTAIDEMFLNFLLDTFRNTVRSAGATENELANDMVSESLARYASGGTYYVDAGTANTYLLSSPLLFVVPKTYFRGMRITFKPLYANTGPATVKVGALPTKKLLSPIGAGLAAGDLSPPLHVDAFYDPSADGGTGAFILAPWSYIIGSPTIWIRGDGNDNNDGSSNDASHAFQTIQAALNYAGARFPFAKNILFQMGISGTYAAPTSVPSKLSSAALTILGDPNAQASYIISGSGASAGFFVMPGVGVGVNATVSLIGLTVQNTGSICHSIGISEGGRLFIDHVTSLMSATSTLAHIAAGRTGFVNIGQGCILNGNAGYGILGFDDGLVETRYNVALSGTPAFSQATIVADGGTLVFGSGVSITGPATGKRFISQQNGKIKTATLAADPNYAPGSVAGVQGTGGQYL